MQPNPSDNTSGKSKTTSLLFAVFLSFWTWLYTYKKDAWKFWVGMFLVISILVVFAIPFFLSEANIVLGLAGLFMPLIILVIYIWAIIDTARKSEQWYKSFSTKYCNECRTDSVEKLSFQSQNNQPSGSSMSTPWKSKRIALVLAILFGPFTWLYTYRRDAWKAAVGLGLTTNATISLGGMFIAIKNVTQSNNTMSVPAIFTFIPFIFLFIFFWLPIWLWAIIDVAKKKEWLLPGIETRNKNIAILLSVLLSPWAWFYTYKKDAWKFWVSLFILSGNIIGFWIIGASWLSKVNVNMVANSFQPWWLPFVFYLINLSILILTVVTTARRSASWYENFGKEEIS